MSKKKEIVIKIKDQDHFYQIYNENNVKLSIIDVFVQWAGACTDVMNSTYKSLLNTIDDCEKRLEFVEVDYEIIKDLGLKEGKIVDEVNGTNVPDLLEKINKHIPLI